MAIVIETPRERVKPAPCPTTSLSAIRDFLRAERQALAPWSTPARAVDELYGLLRERRGDDSFWLRLRDLASRLEDLGFSGAALARSDALGRATVDRLLADLRASLGEGDDGPSTLRDWLGSALSATALCGFLLLGTAAGCAESADVRSGMDAGADPDGGADASQDAGVLCEEATDLGFTGEEGEIYCDLVEIVENADVPYWVKEQIYDCLPELDAAYRENLLAMFQTMSDEELAAYLQQMVDPGGVCWDWDGGTH